MIVPNIGDCIIYNNNQLIAVNKPAGIASQPEPSGEKSMLDLLEIYCKHKLYVVHRLDRPASGILLFAKNKQAVARLHEQFKMRHVAKTYLAVVGQKPAHEHGELRHFLKYDTKKKKTFVVEPITGQEATLQYRWVDSSEKLFLLEVDLQTGRQHQIRAQLAAVGLPIRGDDKYGFKRGNKDRSIQLHAWKLSFKHPISEQEVHLVAPLPLLPVWDAFNYPKQ